MRHNTSIFKFKFSANIMEIVEKVTELIDRYH